jgi:hypothetical protein
VIPRAVLPPEGGPIRGVCVECTGEGVVLLDPVGQPVEAAQEARAPKSPSVPPPPPPPAEKNLADQLGDELRDEAQTDAQRDEF